MKNRKHIVSISFALALTIVIAYLFFPQIYIKIVTEEIENSSELS